MWVLPTGRTSNEMYRELVENRFFSLVKALKIIGSCFSDKGALSELNAGKKHNLGYIKKSEFLLLSRSKRWKLYFQLKKCLLKKLLF